MCVSGGWVSSVFLEIKYSITNKEYDLSLLDINLIMFLGAIIHFFYVSSCGVLQVMKHQISGMMISLFYWIKYFNCAI